MCYSVVLFADSALFLYLCRGISKDIACQMMTIRNMYVKMIDLSFFCKLMMFFLAVNFFLINFASKLYESEI